MSQGTQGCPHGSAAQPFHEKLSMVPFTHRGVALRTSHQSLEVGFVDVQRGGAVLNGSGVLTEPGATWADTYISKGTTIAQRP